MKSAIGFVVKRVLEGLLLIVPIYLAVIILIKGMSAVERLIHPFTHLLPEGIAATQVLSALMVLVICFLLGAALETRRGRRAKAGVENALLVKIPGYTLFKGLTKQLAGEDERAWRPALVEIEEALVPGFIIEELPDARYTVFVPSIPTPFAGAVYVIERGRVHPVDVPFTEAIRVITKWGFGAGNMVAAMERDKPQ
jgi:uncharacterized membrane protein